MGLLEPQPLALRQPSQEDVGERHKSHRKKSDDNKRRRCRACVMRKHGSSRWESQAQVTGWEATYKTVRFDVSMPDNEGKSLHSKGISANVCLLRVCNKQEHRLCAFISRQSINLCSSTTFLHSCACHFPVVLTSHSLCVEATIALPYSSVITTYM